MQGGNYPQQQQWGGQPQGNDTQQAPPNQVQMNPSTGQPDYSMQWAEYYRSLGNVSKCSLFVQLLFTLFFNRFFCVLSVSQNFLLNFTNF